MTQVINQRPRRVLLWLSIGFIIIGIALWSAGVGIYQASETGYYYDEDYVTAYILAGLGAILNLVGLILMCIWGARRNAYSRSSPSHQQQYDPFQPGNTTNSTPSVAPGHAAIQPNSIYPHGAAGTLGSQGQPANNFIYPTYPMNYQNGKTYHVHGGMRNVA